MDYWCRMSQTLEEAAPATWIGEPYPQGAGYYTPYGLPLDLEGLPEFEEESPCQDQENPWNYYYNGAGAVGDVESLTGSWSVQDTASPSSPPTSPVVPSLSMSTSRESTPSSPTSSSSKTSYRCDCGDETEYKHLSGLKRHQDTHKRPYYCPHVHCARHATGFSRVDNLRTHLAAKMHADCCPGAEGLNQQYPARPSKVKKQVARKKQAAALESGEVVVLNIRTLERLIRSGDLKINLQNLQQS